MKRRCAASLLLAAAAAAPANTPAFDCSKAEPGSMPALVCADERLAALDRQLAQVYARAARAARNERPPLLAAEQRGWIKGRDECWKADEPRACIEAAYLRRTAELQARYRLVKGSGPVTFVCSGDERNEVVVNYFDTDPRTAIAERGDEVSMMFQEMAANGTRWLGRNERLWERDGEATMRWGHGAPEMRCVRRR